MFERELGEVKELLRSRESGEARRRLSEMRDLWTYLVELREQGTLCRPSNLGSLLFESAGDGVLHQVDLLLDLGARPDEGVGGVTPLMAACRAGHMHVARRLLERGADPNKVVPESALREGWWAPRGITPLCVCLDTFRYASQSYTPGMVELLVSYGAGLLLAARFGWEPFYLYAHPDQLEVLRGLGVRLDMEVLWQRARDLASFAGVRYKAMSSALSAYLRSLDE